ncbi:MAG: FadD3 family acyl-CoA ligase [Acidimicrobiia bacterium]|nr:FadD3 family acyl-CoA ligase [Acidimicrobiia bacterium]
MGPPNTIPALVDEAAARFGDTEGLVDGDLRLRFAELRDRVDRMAAALGAWGLAPGDRVGLWGPNWWEWAVAALGVHVAGGVVVPVNTRFKGDETAFVLDRSRARLLFCSTGFLGTDHLDLLRSADGGVPSCVEQIVALRGPVPPGVVGFSDFVTQAPESASADAVPEVSDRDPCHIMFTSGTTGRPKGVVLNHGAICRAYRSWAEVIGLRHGDRYLIVNPFFHSFGLNAGILACLMAGATMIPHPVFDVPSVMARIPTERVSVLPGPPAIYQTILNHPDLDTFDLSTLRLAVTGAAAVPVPMIEAMRDRLGFEVVVTGYGLTEASGIATMCRHDDPPSTISATSGRAIDDVEVRVVGPGGAELPRGEPGEIVVRGYNVMDGYLDDPGATASAIDADGWLHTGDIGTMDAAGYVAITDRLKDMFICGGFNAYPAEIEAAMLAHPAVGQVAVVGRPDDRLGEVGHAFVVPAPGASTTEAAGAELVAWCRQRMANYKAPRGVTFTDDLPLTASGKVRKHDLRARLAG